MHKSLHGQFKTLKEIRLLLKQRYGLDLTHYQILYRYHACLGGILRGNAELPHGAKSLGKVWNDEVEEFLKHVKNYYSSRLREPK